MAAALVILACDDDPARPNLPALTADLDDVPDSLAPQGAISVTFNRRITANTALDPANFVVTDTCTGLRVPGTLRLEDDSTVVFTPANALPFLSVLAVRIQSILDVDGGQLTQPITFARTVQGPPVGDISWDFLTSPTSGDLTGISFVSDDVGFLAARNGTVYRTPNGGQVFAAVFKDVTITDVFNVRAISEDTVFMTGSRTVGGTPVAGLLVSTNGAAGFSFLSGAPFGGYFSLVVRRAGTNVIGLAAGLGANPEVRRYDAAANTFTPATGLPPAITPQNLFRIPQGVDLSADTMRAIVAVSLFDPALPSVPTRGGEAYVSATGGRSFTALALPAGTKALQGASFRTSTEAFLVGDSSTVLRVDLTTNQVTALGAAQGIPQTFVDPATGATNVFRFFRAGWAQDGQTGWIVGEVLVDFPNTPDARRGVILQTSDGGATWSRQAIQGAPENGLNFAPVTDIDVLRADFASISGNAGLVATRRGTGPRLAGACSFTNR
jgi:hypothetical protein